MELGISSFTYGWAVGVRDHLPAAPLDEQGLLDRARQHRVSLVQIGDNLPLESFSAARLQNLADRAEREGVRLEVGGRGLTVERVSRYAAIARQLGALLIRFVIDEAEYQPSSESVIKILRECAPRLDGLRLGLENHDRFPAAILREMIESVSSDRIGICLDTANSLGAGEGIESVCTVLGPLTFNWHIKDFAIERLPHQMGFIVSGRPAGRGMLDIPQLLRRLQAFGRCQTAVLELWTPPELKLEATLAKESDWATESLAYLQPMFYPHPSALG